MTATDPALDTPGPAHWQPLPQRARMLFVITYTALSAVPVATGMLVLVSVLDIRESLAVAVAGLLAALLPGAWYGHRLYRSTYWLLDDDGFALRRGRLWQRETRVPASRVQHLDLRHGPLERHWQLATLVLHTAGSRLSSVSVTGLDAGDAERLRDRLARQLDADGDDEA